MKIRIKGNSVRYRLSRTDVTTFLSDGYVQEETWFGSQALTYALQKNTDQDLSASFENNKITIYLPQTMAAQWVQDDCVGFAHQGQLSLLVEKDFQCLDQVEEDQSDNYPNPSITCS